MKRFGLCVVLGIFSALFGESLCEDHIIHNRGVYTFQNKGDYGFLTTSVGKSNKFVLTDTWRDAASQKFRAIQGFVSTAYMLKPTSDETMSIFENNHIVSKAYSGFGLASSQYWTAANSDKGFYQIHNLKTDECLESQGLGQTVTTSACRNAPAQQWAIHSR